MMKKFLNTLLIVMSVFLLIVLFSIISSTLNKNKCSQNILCPEDYLCNVNKKTCVQAEKCPETKPEVCITLYDPVCSNGKEYSNGCFACMKGITSYYKGPC
jgi:hypothetical protein